MNSSPHIDVASYFTIPEPREKGTLESSDGVRIYWERAGKRGAPVVVLANGLGGQLSAWAPLINALQDRFEFLTWHYRGLFESGAPRHIRRLSISNHAEDGLAVMSHCGVRHAYVCGWSMGVQVGLEMAAWEPQRIDGLVLLNGTHGHALTTAFQPFFRFWWMSKVLNEAIEWLRKRPAVIDAMSEVARGNTGLLFALSRIVSPMIRSHVQPILHQYINDIFATDFRNYLRLFQELDAHSVYHLLPNIDTPALVISGGRDTLTPAYQSREIARRMPHARRLHFRQASHFALLEYPHEVVEAAERFFLAHPPKGGGATKPAGKKAGRKTDGRKSATGKKSGR